MKGIKIMYEYQICYLCEGKIINTLSFSRTIIGAIKALKKRATLHASIEIVSILKTNY